MQNYETFRQLYSELSNAVLDQAVKDSKRARDVLAILDINMFLDSAHFHQLCDMAKVDPTKKREEILKVRNTDYQKNVFKGSVVRYFIEECGYSRDKVILVFLKLGFLEKIPSSTRTLQNIMGGTFSEGQIKCIKRYLEL